MFLAEGFAVTAADKPFTPYQFKRRDLLPHDVDIDILYCGICHSDLHTARNEWGGTLYPCVPGHEIVGIVKNIGSKVTKFNIGDSVGVGCLVDSCRECDSCRRGLENYCLTGATFTYNSPDSKAGSGCHTLGGYSNNIVVDENFVLKIPDNLELAAVAPLLCAGITTYSPLKHWKVGPGKTIAIAGLGGLGHVAVKLAVAMGAEVTIITTSEAKKKDAQKLGAHHVILANNQDEMTQAAKSFDLILDTIAADHDIDSYANLLKVDGTLVLLGVPEKPLHFSAFNVILYRRSITGSCIGGIQETQEMLDFCGQHNITADIELIQPDAIDHAYERMLKSDVKYRFVIQIKP